MYRLLPEPTRLRRYLPWLLLAVVAVACSDPGFSRLRPPTDVTAEVVAGGVLVSWTDTSEGEDGFRVYRHEVDSTTGDAEPAVHVGTTDPNEESFLDDTGDPTESYTYAVTAYKGSVESTATAQEGSP